MANPRLKTMRNVPVNVSSIAPIQDHLKIIKALMTDISVKSKKLQVSQMFTIKLSKTAAGKYTGPKITLQVNIDVETRLCKIIAHPI